MDIVLGAREIPGKSASRRLTLIYGIATSRRASDPKNLGRGTRSWTGYQAPMPANSSRSSVSRSADVDLETSPVHRGVMGASVFAARNDFTASTDATVDRWGISD